MTKTVEDCIIHWQKKLNRNPDDDYILNVIGKLYKVPVTREILETTEIAKCIKLVSKRDDLVGEKAKALLNRWKDIFRNSMPEKKSSVSKDKTVNKVNHSSSKQNVSQEKSDRHHKASDYVHKHKHKKRSEIHISPEQSLEKYSKENCNRVSDSSHSSYNSDKYNNYDPVASVNNGYDPDYPELNSSDKSSYDPQYPHLSPSDIIVSKKKLKSINAYKPSPLKRKHEEQENSFDKTDAKRSKTSSNSGYENKTESRKHEDKKDKHSSIKIKDNSHNSSHKKESHEKVVESDKRISEDKKIKHSSKKEKLHSSDSKNNSSDGKTSGERKAEKEKSSSDVKKHKSKKSSDSDGKKSNKPKPAVKLLTSEEFTASNNVSFEDCLGFNDIVPLKKKAPNKVSSTNKIPTTKSDSTKLKPSKKVSTSSPHKDVSETVNHHQKMDVPKPLKLDVSDITSTLPDVEMNYDFSPYDFTSPKKKVLTNEEAIKFTSSRREKTAVYSGKKSFYTEVPTLMDLCTRVLIDNIDAIESIPGVPYFLMKPVLERCTPTQLCNIENYNPDFIDSTNELWEIHCRRDCKLLKPQEHETWRELYLRAYDEREKRLKSVTANISKSMNKATPLRKVILAYVDSVAKPPRDVARRQAKHGTANQESHTPKAGMSPKATISISKPTTKTTTSHQSPLRSSNTTNSSVAVSVPSTSSVKQKPKVAPLMAKALKSMKQCFRRK